MNHAARPRLVRVLSAETVGRHTRRIFFTSPELADYPCDGAGVPFKLLLPHSGQSEPKMPDRFANGRPQWDRPSEKPISRTYTVRRFDRAARILTVDFVLHGDNGPAAAFAAQAAPGQTVGITAPKRGTLLKPAAEYLMAGDLTALPAIAAMLEELAQQSPAARGKVLLLLPEAADLPELVRPAGIEILPFFGGSGQNPAIAAAVSQSRPAGGDCYVWFAAEAALVAALRPIARQDWGLPPARCYAVPYWRQGEAEEAYHEQRHAFVDNDAP